MNFFEKSKTLSKFRVSFIYFTIYTFTGNLCDYYGELTLLHGLFFRLRQNQTIPFTSYFFRFISKIIVMRYGSKCQLDSYLSSWSGGDYGSFSQVCYSLSSVNLITGILLKSSNNKCKSVGTLLLSQLSRKLWQFQELKANFH